MIRFFTTHPTAAQILMILIIAVGLVSLPRLKRETFPDFSPQQVEIRVIYPGASSADIEIGVCRKLEQAIEKIDFLDEYRCLSQESVAVFTAKMLDHGNMIKFINDIKTEVDAIDSFPADIEAPIIQQLHTIDRVVTLAVTAPMPPAMLKIYAEELKDRLRRLPTVSQVTIQGFSERQFQIILDEAELANFGLSADQLAKILAEQNLDVPAGTLKVHGADLLVRVIDERRSLAGLREIPVLSNPDTGVEIKLGDIARVKDGFKEIEQQYYMNGERAAFLTISKSKQEDTIEVIHAIKSFVAQEKQRAPPGFHFYLTQDLSSIVVDRLNLLVRNAIQGFILVMLVMTCFFKWRYALWVGAGLPVAFLGSFFLMIQLDISVNMISLVALLISTGLLMDDAIVIAENIATHRARGQAPIDAAIEGTKEVLPGVVSSFLTTCAIFIPLVFISGDIGKVLRVIPILLIVVLCVSLLEAFLILPFHLSHSLQHEQKKPGLYFSDRINLKLMTFRDTVVRDLIRCAMQYRYLFLGMVIAFGVLTFGLVQQGWVKFIAFPEIEGDNIQVRLQLPQGTPFETTERMAQKISNALWEVDQELFREHGKHYVEQLAILYSENRDVNESGGHLATISADVLKAEKRDVPLDDIFARWRKKVGVIPDAMSVNFREPEMGPGGRAIEIQIIGESLEQMKSIAMDLQQWLSGYPGVSNLNDNLTPGKPEIRMTLKSGALALGWDIRAVAMQLRAGFQGIEVSEIQIGRESLEIEVKIAQADQYSLFELEDFSVIGQDGTLYPLSEIVDFKLARGFANIDRWDGSRTVTVTGEVDTRFGNSREILADTKATFIKKAKKDYPDVMITYKGQDQEANKTMDSMIAGFKIGVLFIFLILTFLFRSYVAPLTVMSAIPLAFIGVIWGHFILGLSISMPSILGFVSLAGIVVNDSILLVRRLQFHLRSGLSILDAAIQASTDRFRAILLTSITTIAGLTPLLFERSLQAQVLIPLVASIAFGLIASTILVLFVVPSFYHCLMDFRLIQSLKPIKSTEVLQEEY